MKHCISILASILFLTMAAPPAFAFTLAEWHPALGASASFNSSAADPKSSFEQFSPEVVAYGYHHLSGPLWLRPGVRLGFTWHNPEMPSAVQIRDFDTRLGVETGILLNGPIIPSLTLGTGLIYRHTSLVTASEIITVEKDLISGSSLLPYLRAQVGLGIPIQKGWMVIEPYARYTQVLADPRAGWGLGIEATLSI